MQQIVYRDLAPYSVIVTPKGYIKLQLILEMKYIPTGKCATMLNYSHYTAPEVMKSTGYSFAVDLWSLGICFYEFMCGKLPWANSTEDP
jgi:cGMP-dependent protein kinase